MDHVDANHRYSVVGRATVAVGDFDESIVVAPPRTPAELRKHYDKAVSGRLVAEIDKDLIRHPVNEIAAILSR